MGGNSPVICLKSATTLNDPGISVITLLYYEDNTYSYLSFHKLIKKCGPQTFLSNSLLFDHVTWNFPCCVSISMLCM